jgi:Rap1a immunity proteins
MTISPFRICSTVFFLLTAAPALAFNDDEGIQPLFTAKALQSTCFIEPSNPSAKEAGWICEAYIIGFADGATSQSILREGGPIWCIPTNTSGRQIAAAVKENLKGILSRQADLGSADALTALSVAFMATYLCETKK